jgi:hypothetical protein
MLSPTQQAELREHARTKSHFTGVFGPWMEHLVEDEGLSVGQAREALEPCKALPYIDSKQGHIATLIKKNKEVHLALFRKYRGKGYINARRIKEFFEPILNDEVFLVTKVGEKEDARFIERLGFEKLGVDA